MILTVLVNCNSLLGQNIGINTDGSTAESGTLLDVKGSNSKTSTNVLQNIFQIKSLDASTDALKLRLGLYTNSGTLANQYGVIDVPEYSGGSILAYRHLALQPLGGNVGVGTVTPGKTLDVAGTGRFSSDLFAETKIVFNSNAAWYYIGGGVANGYIAQTWDEIRYKFGGGGADITFKNGNIGVGTITPAAKIEVDGTSGSTIKIVDTNQGLNKVLTSDANGQGSWQTLTSIGGGGCFTNWQLFSASGTFTVAAGVTVIKVEVWGGGGGGATAAGLGNRGGGGGGGGGYAEGTYTVTPAATHAVTIGTGGAAGTPGVAGGTTSFGSPTVISATGGTGGFGTGGTSGGNGGAGGLGSGGYLNSTLGSGGSGGYSAGASPAQTNSATNGAGGGGAGGVMAGTVAAGGGGGGIGGGNGGGFGSTSGQNAIVNTGAGGGGSCDSGTGGTGGAGAAGQVIVFW